MASQKLRELAVPPAVHTDPNAFELARVWAAHNSQHVTLNISSVHEPAAWGLFLVDLARHLAYIYQQEKGYPIEETLEGIKEGFEAEWQNHTTDLKTEKLDESLPPPSDPTSRP